MTPEDTPPGALHFSGGGVPTWRGSLSLLRPGAVTRLMQHSFLTHCAQVARKKGEPLEFPLPLSRLQRIRVRVRGVRPLEQHLTASAGSLRARLEVVRVEGGAAWLRLSPPGADRGDDGGADRG